MRFAYTKAGEPLEELAARTYAFQGKESATQLRTAAKALRDANPFLRRLSDVPEGTLLVIPPLEDAAPAPATQPPEGAAAALVAARLRDAAQQAIELLAGELHQDVADTKSSIDVLTLGRDAPPRAGRRPAEARPPRRPRRRRRPGSPPPTSSATTASRSRSRSSRTSRSCWRRSS